MNRHYGLALPTLAIVALGCACASTQLKALPLKEGAGATAPKIVVLESQKNELAEVVLKGFLENTDAQVVAFSDIDKIPPATLQAAVEAQQPAMILALGTSASLFSRDRLPQVPKIFALVLNYRAHSLDTAGMMGIAMEGAPVSEFTQFKMVLPTLQRVLVPCDAALTDAVWQQTTAELRTLDVALTVAPMHGAVDLAAAIEGAKDVDAIWLSADPVVLSQAKQLLTLAEARHLPVVTSVSARLAYAGALASVAVDIPSIGPQAANMANDFLFGHSSASSIGIQSPIGTRLVVNREVARQIGIDIPLTVLPFIGEIATSVQRLP